MMSDIPKPQKPTDEIAALKAAINAEIARDVHVLNSCRMADLRERVNAAIDRYHCNDRCGDAIAWRLNSRGLSQVLDKAIERLKHARKQRDEARAEATRLQGELRLAMRSLNAIAETRRSVEAHVLTLGQADGNIGVSCSCGFNAVVKDGETLTHGALNRTFEAAGGKIETI